MPTFSVGQRLFGPGDVPLIVEKIEGDVVTLYHPTTLIRVERTIAEVEEWKLGSAKRIYYPENYEDRRTKLRTGTWLEEGLTPPDGVDATDTFVAYIEPTSSEIKRVTQDEWLAWRNALSN